MIKNVNVAKAYANRVNALKAVIADDAKTHISLGNTKMGLIPSFSVLALITCFNCADCSKNCYACLNNFNFSNVLKALAENTYLVMNDIARVEHEINEFLGGINLYRYFRFNVSGDVFSIEYLNMIVNVAKANPLTNFLVFTKNFDLFNQYLDDGNEIPENLSIVFSRWDNSEFDNRHNFPVAVVKVDENTRLSENSYHCSGKCDECLECWKAKKGTERHFDLH